MRTKVASYVRSQGFQYISVDFTKFKDDDYFDYNHLNAKGSQRYDKMLADLLRPLLKRGGAK
jgi:poly-D-alanine transfer protein DltD